MYRVCRPSPLDAARRIAMGLFVVLAGISIAEAHEGPPFPILMDQKTKDYVVSVWADPDIGEATFFIIVEAPGGGPPAKEPQVTMWAEPASGRLDRTTYDADRQALRNQLQFAAQPYFDQRDMWKVGFRVVGPGGRTDEVTTEVESTPPGYGPWDLIIYLFPFALLAGLWIVATIRRRRAFSRQAEAGADEAAKTGAATRRMRRPSKTAARPQTADQ